MTSKQYNNRMNYGYFRAGCTSPALTVADTSTNEKSIVDLVKKANGSGVNLLVFPELSITGYTCQDLFQQKTLETKAVESLISIAKKQRQLQFSLQSDFPYPTKAAGIIAQPLFITAKSLPSFLKHSFRITVNSTKTDGLPHGTEEQQKLLFPRDLKTFLLELT